MKNKKIKFLSLLFLILGNVFLCFSQERDVDIAHEYFEAGEYDKAKHMYERLSKNASNLPFIYQNYVFTLLHYKEKEAAEKFIKRMIKTYGDNLEYKLDHYVLVYELYGDEKSEKEFQGIVSEVKNNAGLTEKVAGYLLKQNLSEKTKQLLLASRKSLKNNSLYVVLLAEILYKQGNLEATVDELLNWVKQSPEELEAARNTLQNILKEEKDFDFLETRLYEKVQSDADNISYNELLLWLNLQKRNFNKAYIQARAIDKRNKLQGEKMLEIGKVAMENKDFAAATRFYEYIVKEYPQSIHYPIARRETIRAKEESIKNTFPVEKSSIQSLLLDYKGLLKELGGNQATIEARRNMAMLYALYLDNIDTASVILNEAIQLARTDIKGRNKAKIDLGDLHLLKEEPWEATLLYSQVEKEMKEDPLGHEAKLRNAKLSYYKGDFELAQGHLDVLKLATSREISNDAMELSILIQDNIGLDSTEEAMREYAAIDLLLFRNKINEALKKTEDMMKRFPNHSLTDEILWLQAKIYRKMGNYEEAIRVLEKISTSFADDILGDNALFMLGSIYEENLKDFTKAMDIYQRFMLKYPASIFNAEARKRFRLLRGDKL